MVAPFTLFIVAGSIAVAAWSLWRLVRRRPVIMKQLLWAGVLQVLLFMQLIVASVLLILGAEVAEPAVLWGYLISILFILPVAAGWAFADRTKWSSAVLLTAAITLIVLQERLIQVWGA